MSVNICILVGNLTRAPEVKVTPSGTSVANLGLAVNRTYTVSGEKREEVGFFTIVAWGKLAEQCAEHLDKGSKVLVEGRLQSRSWESKDGQKRTAVEVNASSIQFISYKKRDGGSTERGDDIASPADTEVPF